MIQRDELYRLITDDEKALALLERNEQELEEDFGEDFAKMKGYNQNNPYHCYDLLEHTLRTVTGITATDERQKNRLLFGEYCELRTAALLHDIGKPEAAQPKDGRTVFYDHAEKSKEIAASLLNKMGFNNDAEKARILFYIGHHDDFINYRKNPVNSSYVKITAENVVKRINGKIAKYDGGLFAPDYRLFRNLLVLHKADINAQAEEVRHNGMTIKKAARLEDSKELLKIANELQLIKKSFIYMPFTCKSEEKPALTDIQEKLNKNPAWFDFSEKDKTKKNLYSFISNRVTGDCTPQTLCLRRRIMAEDWPSDIIALSRETKKKDYGFVSAYIYCFETGINLLCFELEMLQDDFIKNMDLLYNMKTFNSNDIHILQKLADNLLKEVFGEVNYLSSLGAARMRAYTLTYYESVQPQNKPELNEMLFRLGHCYGKNFDYLEDTDDRVETYRNNSICDWAITAEAAACLVYAEGKNAVNFVTSRFRSAFSDSYGLVYALLLHQKHILYGFMNKIGAELKDGEKAKKYRSDFYEFEKNYNFRSVSEMPQYQNVYALMYSASQIDTLMEDVKEPLDAISNMLAEEAQERETETDKTTNNALAIISILAIFSALIDAWQYISAINFKLNNRNILQLIISAIIIIVFIIIFIKAKMWTFIFGSKNDKKKKSRRKT